MRIRRIFVCTFHVPRLYEVSYNFWLVFSDSFRLFFRLLRFLDGLSNTILSYRFSRYLKIIIDSFVRIARFVEFKIVGNFKLKRNALSNIRAGIETAWTKFPVTSKILVKYVQKKKERKKKTSIRKFNHPGQTTSRQPVFSSNVTLFHSIERQQTGPYHFSFRSRDDRVLEMWDTPLGEQTKASGFPRVENRKQRKGGRPDIFIHDPETSVRASRVFFRDENPPWHPLELPAVGN